MYEFSIQTTREIDLLLMGDFHIGHEKFHKDMFLRALRYVAHDPRHRFWFGVGDYHELDAPNIAPKGALWNQNMTPQEQADWLIDACQHVPPLGLLTGNHDDRLFINTGIDLVKMVARALDCVYMEDGGYVKINVSGATYTLFLQHGAGGSRTKDYSLRRAIKDVGVQADIVAIGHNHTLYYDKMVRATEGDASIIHTIRTGSFLGGKQWKDQPKYARRSQWPLAQIGCPIIKLWPNKKKIKVDIDTMVL